MTSDTCQAPAAVFVNGAQVPDAAGLSLADLLVRLGEPAEHVATALNGQFVARDGRDSARLAGGDQVTVFKAIVGG